MTSPISFELVTKALNKLSLHKRDKQLTEGERTVLSAIWEGQTYEEAARRSGHDSGYLESVASYELRGFISKALGSGQSLRKRELRPFLEKHAAVLQSLVDGIPQPSPSGDSEARLLEIIGGQPPEVPVFYGRQTELKDLQDKVESKNCVAVVGAPGVGKTALAVKLLEQFALHSAPPFDCVLWKSVFYAPSLEELLAEINPLLASFLGIPREPRPGGDLSSELLGYLRKARILVILDSVEAVIQGKIKSLTPYGKQYVSYGNLFRRVSAEQLSSRLLLLSRRPLTDILRLSYSGDSAYLVQLGGLNEQEGMQLLRDNGLTDEHRWSDLIKLYRGNAYLLWQAARNARELFGGRIERFIKMSIAEDPHFLEALDEQIGPASSSDQEKWVVTYLARQIEQGIDPVSVMAVMEAVRDPKSGFPGSTSELAATIALLAQSGMIERVEEEAALQLTLPPLMKKYITLRNP